MEEYRVEISRSASGNLSDLDAGIVRRVLASIESLAAQPHPRQSRKLVGSERSFRLRIGDYRVLYEVDDHNHVVTVFAVGHRREVYRQ